MLEMRIVVHQLEHKYSPYKMQISLNLTKAPYAEDDIAIDGTVHYDKVV